MQIQFSEKELEDFLCKDKNLEKYLGLNFVARQVTIEPMGIIDILGFSKSQKCWVIIELKKSLLDKDSIIQGLSYLNYYKSVSNYKDRFKDTSERAFKLLLVGQNLDNSIKKIVHHYNSSFSRDWDIYYSLFSLKFDEGVSVNYYNVHQKEISDKIDGIYSERNTNLRLDMPVNSRCIPDF